MSGGRFGLGDIGKLVGSDSRDPVYLDSLVDVSVSSPVDGYVLTWDNGNSEWNAQSASAADTKTYVYEAGIQVGSTAKYVNFDGGDFNVAEEASYFTVTAVAGGMIAHDMTGAYHTESATGGTGNVIRATGTTTFDWAQLGHGDLSGVTSDLHHAQSHALSGGDHSGDLAYTQIDDIVDIVGTGANNLLSRADHVHTDADGSSKITYTDLSSIPSTFDPTDHVLSGTAHTASGLTVGDAIMADSVSTFSWQTPSYYSSFTTDFAAESLANLNTRTHASLSDAPTDAHHSESHALDAAVHTGTLPLTDLVVGTQGSVIRRGVADWEELTLGTTNYALVAGASDAAWAQYDYTWLANIPSTFAPTSHGSSDHTGAIFAGANDSLGAFYLDIDDIAVPADPAVGQRRIFVNTSDGKLSVRTNASTTISLEEQGGADADAIHDNVADEINQIADKASPVGADVIIIEDSAGAAWTKKKVSITNLPGGADADAIHDNVVDEIHQITLKGTPVSADELVIEDSVASWAKKRITISSLPAGSPSFGSPTGAIDIGDAQADGVSTDSTRADHQHAFSAPGAGYPLDTANTENDGTATTPARSDHVHALGAHIHSVAAGEGGTITWANALAVASAGDHAHSGNTAGGTLTWANALAVAAAGSHDHSDNTKGDAVPEASITFSATGHDHDGTGSENVDYTNLSSIPSDFTPAAHTLAVTGPHTGELPWADMAAGAQGSVIRRGAGDWEELALSTTNFALVCTATDATWAQYDYTWLANIPSDFTPSTHGSSAHTGAIFAGANDSFGAFYLDMDDIAVPADPAVGQRRLFVDTATGKLSVRTNASTTVSLEEQGGGVTWGTPTGDIDIGDAAVEGTSGNATRADHQHAFTAPGAGYPLDTANAEADGSATTPARSDHVHALGAHIHSVAAGEGGTITWANALAVADAGTHAHSGNTAGGTLTWANALAAAAAGDHDHSDNTKGNAVPEASITFSGAGHAHTGTTGGTLLDWDTCWTDAAHDHSTAAEGGEIPVASLANGTQYQVLRAGVTDPAFADEEFTKGGLIGGTIAVGYKTIWIAPFACTIVLLRGRQKGGTSTVINARVNGTGQVGTADLTLTTTDTSYSTGTLTTTAIALGEFLEIEVVTIGSATEILIQMDITRP